MQHHMVVVIPSYKNAQWYERNLASVFEQTYKNYSVIYIDDASPDKTGDLVEAYVKKMGKQESVRVIKNAINKGAMANIYAAIHSVDASAIIVTLDGDDFFAKSSVLELINKVYNKYDVVLTYGSYQEYAYKGEPGHNCQQVPKDIIDQRVYRCMDFFAMSQLKTFKAGRFRAIAKEDLMYE